MTAFQNQQATISKEQALTKGMYQEKNYKIPKLALAEMKKDSFPQPSPVLNGNNTGINCSNESMICQKFHTHPDFSELFHKDTSMQGMSNQSNVNGKNKNENFSVGDTRCTATQRGMVLSFTPLYMSFDNVNHFVEIPPVRVNIFLIRSCIAN